MVRKIILISILFLSFMGFVFIDNILAEKKNIPLKIWVEQSNPGGPVNIYWSPNLIEKSGMLIFEFLKCYNKGEPNAKGKIRGTLFRGMITGPNQPPQELKGLEPGSYLIRITGGEFIGAIGESSGKSLNIKTDWVKFQVKGAGENREPLSKPTKPKKRKEERFISEPSESI